MVEFSVLISFHQFYALAQTLLEIKVDKLKRKVRAIYQICLFPIIFKLVKFGVISFVVSNLLSFC